MGRGSLEFKPYQFDPAGYIKRYLRWEPWRAEEGSGVDGAIGQADIMDAYALALRQLHERDDFEQGKIGEEALTCWKPGEVIGNVLRIEAGHTVGKTKLASGIVSHFHDCFRPSIVYFFAPSAPQIRDLLWKEVRADRQAANLPGRLLETCELRTENPLHFAVGRATNDAGGRGTERVHGQHGRYLLFVVDEAEGVADFVFRAIESMMGGGIVIVVLIANPRTRSSTFYKWRLKASCKSFRISCLAHPNVLQDRNVIPGAVRRDYIRDMVGAHCEPVAEHAEDDHTFCVPYAIQTADQEYPAGTIFRPDSEFLFRVLGIPPANITGNTFCPFGRFEAAVARGRSARPYPRPAEGSSGLATIGVDAARFGTDPGTVYAGAEGVVWLEETLSQQDTGAYLRAVKAAARKLAAAGSRRLSIRVDGGGGYGAAVIDGMRADLDIRRLFPDGVIVHEVHNNGAAQDQTQYADTITELYATASALLSSLAVRTTAADTLAADLCERVYKWRVLKGRDVRELEEKDAYRKRHEGRSPDHGDGFVYAAAPERLFRAKPSGEAAFNPADMIGGFRR
jgi:hypothetical protein